MDSFKPAQTAIAPKINPDANLGQFLTGSGFNLITFFFFIIGMLFFINLIMAAYDYLLSQGDSKRIAGATTRITQSFIGIVVVLGSFVIVRVISAMVGLENQF